MTGDFSRGDRRDRERPCEDWQGPQRCKLRMAGHPSSQRGQGGFHPDSQREQALPRLGPRPLSPSPGHVAPTPRKLRGIIRHLRLTTALQGGEAVSLQWALLFCTQLDVRCAV